MRLPEKASVRGTTNDPVAKAVRRRKRIYAGVMTRLIIAAALATLCMMLAAFPSAQAQIDVQIGRAPAPRGGPMGDRDRDGIPNAYDRHDDRRGPMGDRDRDGIPNQFDRNDNRAGRDRDGDGVPERLDRDDRQ